FVNSIRIGMAGSSTELEPIRTIVYQSLDELSADIVRVSGNGIEIIVVTSLPSFINTFGSSGLLDLQNAIQSQNIVGSTYTFRIYAFRAVVMAIDSFDFLIY
ncbi:MAG: hypothetical protein P1Q69_11920, partial [Candidatus Thorarchaeota archaeon]|nr:hypothetical protein [Candidatus Thorarchaeota archaeon]